MHPASVNDSVVAARIWRVSTDELGSGGGESYNQRDCKFKGEPRNLLFAINVT
jgi:hypothetical protein